MERYDSQSARAAVAPTPSTEPYTEPHSGASNGMQAARLMPAAPLVPQRAAPVHHAASVPPALAQRTSATAATLHAALGEAYLAFRRAYYHEDSPSLNTPPPPHAEIRQAELARTAESVLRVMPPAVKSLPIVGGLVEHLQNVANLHSISERERAALHNLTMVVLDGLTDGIQPWFVSWRLETARRLSTVPDGEYYLTFPWESLLYLAPAELAQLEDAAQSGDVAAIEREMRRLSDRLIGVLRDPIGCQPDLVFVGPDADRQRLRFHLKTTVALTLAVYIVFEEARRLFNPPRTRTVPSSALPPVPAHVQAHLLSNRQT